LDPPEVAMGDARDGDRPSGTIFEGCISRCRPCQRASLLIDDTDLDRPLIVRDAGDAAVGINPR
jgi:hypothetical protein